MLKSRWLALAMQQLRQQLVQEQQSSEAETVEIEEGTSKSKTSTLEESPMSAPVPVPAAPGNAKKGETSQKAAAQATAAAGAAKSGKVEADSRAFKIKASTLAPPKESPSVTAVHHCCRKYSRFEAAGTKSNEVAIAATEGGTKGNDVEGKEAQGRPAYSRGNEIEGRVWGTFLNLNLESRIIVLL